MCKGDISGIGKVKLHTHSIHSAAGSVCAAAVSPESSHHCLSWSSNSSGSGYRRQPEHLPHIAIRHSSSSAMGCALNNSQPAAKTNQVTPGTAPCSRERNPLRGPVTMILNATRGNADSLSGPPAWLLASQDPSQEDPSQKGRVETVCRAADCSNLQGVGTWGWTEDGCCYIGAPARSRGCCHLRRCHSRSP
jgi:hypothetical protein